jgi:hypothetical protein
MTAMSETNYVIMDNTVIAFPEPHIISADVSGSFTFDATTSAESNVNIFLAPKEPNSPILRGGYSQQSPLKTPSPNSIIAALAENQPTCTIELQWVTPTPPTLTFAGCIYTNHVTGQRLVGVCAGRAVPATQAPSP